MIRTTDIELLRRIEDHPSVQAAVVDLAPVVSPEEFLADERNVVFANDHGYVAYHYAAPQTYIGHYCFVEGYRGRKAITACQLTLDAMFGIYNALSIWACVPLQIKGSALLLRWLGFKQVGEADGHTYYVLKGF